MMKSTPQQRQDRTKKKSSPKLAQLLLGFLIVLTSSFLLLRFISPPSPSAQLPPTDSLTTSASEMTTIKFNKKANKALANSTRLADLPLILQKDERWHDDVYGGGTFAKNGCAIAVLAMMDSYWNQRSTTTGDILAWSGDDYFVEDQGTSWSIFSSFAEDFGYQLSNPSSISDAEAAIAAGQPVIVSLQPGTFTTTGHFLILFANTAGELVVYDPNDDETKRHYEKTFSPDIFEAEALNYWVLSK